MRVGNSSGTINVHVSNRPGAIEIRECSRCVQIEILAFSSKDLSGIHADHRYSPLGPIAETVAISNRIATIDARGETNANAIRNVGMAGRSEIRRTGHIRSLTSRNIEITANGEARRCTAETRSGVKYVGIGVKIAATVGTISVVRCIGCRDITSEIISRVTT